MSFEDGLKLSKFSGSSNQDFELFRTKLIAIGALKDGFHEAYLKDLTIKTQDAVVDALNAKLVTIAWSHLLIVLEGPPGQMVKNITSQNPYKAWKVLCQRYEPMDVEAYTRINQEFESCTMEDPYEDPEIWLTQMIGLNVKMGNIDKSYFKSEVIFISHVMNKLPRGTYEQFITAYQLQGQSSLTLYQFQNKIRDYWLRSVKGRGGHIAMTVVHSNPVKEEPKAKANDMSEMRNVIRALETKIAGLESAPPKQEPDNWRPPVRHCTFCGRYGHEAHYCRQAGRGGGGRGPPGGNFGQPQGQRTCHYCKQPGHYIANCPLKPNQQGPFPNEGGQGQGMQYQQNVMRAPMYPQPPQVHATYHTNHEPSQVPVPTAHQTSQEYQHEAPDTQDE